MQPINAIESTFPRLEFSAPLPASNGPTQQAYISLRNDIRQSIEHGFAPVGADGLSSQGASMAQLNHGARAWLEQHLQNGNAEQQAAPGHADLAHRQGFLAEIAPMVQQAAKRLGVAPQLIEAHAALESNWGRQPIGNAQNKGYNLFGIKAGASWSGDVADTLTHEEVRGRRLRMAQSFRAYGGYEDAFDDYADMLEANPRYDAALRAGDDAYAFGLGLQRGGYATDSAYASKLAAVAQQIVQLRGDGG